MNRKQLTAAVGLLAAGTMFALAGCSSTPDSPASSAAATCDTTPVTLTLSSWRTEDVDTYNDKIFPAFEAENPCIDVEFEAPVVNTEYNQWLTTALVGSDGPDLAMVRAYGGLQAWTQDLQPLDDIVPGLGDIAGAVLQGSKGVDGKIYSVPTVTQTAQMFYNKDLFDQYGLSVPTTWDDFVKVEDTLLQNGVTPLAVGAKDNWVLPMITDIIGASRYGATDFESGLVGGTAKLTDADYVAAVQLMKDQQQYMNEGDNVNGVSYTDSQTEFATGLAAMFPGGTYELTTFKTQNPDLNVGTFPVPAAPGSPSGTAVVPAYADGGWAINAHIDAAKQDAAEKLVNWLDSAEFGQLIADNLFMFSAVPGVTYSDPVLQQMWSDYQASPAAYLLLVHGRYGKVSATTALGNDENKLFSGEMTAEQIGADLQSQLDAGDIVIK